MRRTFEEGAFADRALHAEAADLPPRERALAQAIAYTAVQRAATLDHVAAALAGRPARRFDPDVRVALRVGLAQLLFLDGVKPHAAVDAAVAQAREAGSRGSGLVNAVLRRAAEGDAAPIVAALDDRTPAGAAVAHSVPERLARLLFDELGADEARAFLAAANEPAESALRANTLRTTVDELAAALPVPTRRAPGVPEGVVLEAPFDAHGDPLFAAGAYVPQSRASMRVGRTLDPQPGERVLDLCSAPGGKATHAAALMHGEGRIDAVERHKGRAGALVRTAQRLGASEAIAVHVADAAAYDAGAGSYERALVDPPCTGLGTLRSRPDLRWRVDLDGLPALAALQGRILDTALRAARERVVYATCTVTRAENEEVVAAALARNDGWVEDPERGWSTWPQHDGTDAFRVAVLVRSRNA